MQCKAESLDVDASPVKEVGIDGRVGAEEIEVIEVGGGGVVQAAAQRCLRAQSETGLKKQRWLRCKSQ